MAAVRKSSSAKHHARARTPHDEAPETPVPPKPVGPGELTRAFLHDHGLDAQPRAAKGDLGGSLVELARDQITSFLDRFVSWLLADYDVTYKPGHEPDDDEAEADHPADGTADAEKD
jgi:hypothetical protein